MKNSFLLSACLGILTYTTSAQNIGSKIKEKIKQRSDAKVDNAIDKGLDKVDPAKTETSASTNNTADNNSTAQTQTVTAAPASLKTYQNYDFVPGDKILFEDNFAAEQDGEFPAQWELLAGQAVVNKVNGERAFYLTEGNYARVKPRMKTDSYLTDPFTVEYDMYFLPESYGVMTMFKYKNADGYESESSVHVDHSEVAYAGEASFSKSLPDNDARDNFDNKWHHIAIAYKNRQLKVYVDQNRLLVVPDTKATFERVEFAGIGDEKNPIIFKNVRIASGGNMNMIGKKFTEAKIVTHGINFDIDKATIRPESMGTLNMIVQVMKDIPDIRFEIDGHTDNSGTSPHNLTLSQQRADAVKDQLIKLGVDPSRLSSKGFGDTKPLNDNATPDAKANNRRVEFIKR